ncbi:hypothetical protein [Wolbachia endosymbiont of Ctenocephalides felis wCfeJ]|uniref:hypothetical protein n=1 Tax=Wolbachia endosymbiont of Ctenocephalides felis wCfeJ TaxID=2732594 RepID=UPI001448728A|nr:hypothetical protein [Wolbachia endosymbiont of Ctenocephalides felis wCfeJ]WCR57730.1 MAG: hypothetical protein PG980_000202 [Wolbachia endosymbiont of Ctenocephalides felis wCfeJ]
MKIRLYPFAWMKMRNLLFSILCKNENKAGFQRHATCMTLLGSEPALSAGMTGLWVSSEWFSDVIQVVLVFLSSQYLILGSILFSLDSSVTRWNDTL